MDGVLEGHALGGGTMLEQSLVNDASQREQSIHPRFRLIRRPGSKTKLSISRVVLEGAAYCPEKQDAGERECVIQALPSVQMQKSGFEPFFGWAPGCLLIQMHQSLLGKWKCFLGGHAVFGLLGCA